MGKIKAGPCPARVTVFSKIHTATLPARLPFSLHSLSPRAFLVAHLARMWKASRGDPHLVWSDQSFPLACIRTRSSSRSSHPRAQSLSPPGQERRFSPLLPLRPYQREPPSRCAAPTIDVSPRRHSNPASHATAVRSINTGENTLSAAKLKLSVPWGTREHLHAAENVDTTRPSILYLRLFQQAAGALPLPIDGGDSRQVLPPMQQNAPGPP